MSRARINTDDQVRALRLSGRALAGVMEALIERAKPGVTTLELGNLAEELIHSAGGEPIFKGYGKAWGAPPFPAAVCLSVNEEVVHGIPRPERTLKEGDLLKIDIGLRLEGMITDMARTIPVGVVSKEARRLLETTERALLDGVAVLRAGATVNEYARAVEGVVYPAGFSCVHDLVGHGVGLDLHEEPQIPNFLGSRLPNVTFEHQQSIALEPMVNLGSSAVELAEDGWTFVTKDRKLSAHFEDTVLVTESGHEILTRPS